MDQLPVIVLSYVFIYITYLSGKFTIAITQGIHESHLFLGYGKKAVFSFNIRKLKISIGFFVPLPFLGRFYNYDNGIKKRIKHEWEYFDQPFGKRVLLIVSGSLAMLLMSAILFSIQQYRYVESYIPKEEVDKYGVYPSSTGKSIGFKKGDRILLLNGDSFDRFSSLHEFDEEQNHFSVIRNGDTLLVELPATGNIVEPLFYPNSPFRVTKVVPGMEAERVGIKSGDKLIGINSLEISSLEEFKDVLELVSGDSVSVVIKRENEYDTLMVKVPAEGKLGFYSESLISYKTRRKNIVEAIVTGFRLPFQMLWINIKALTGLVDREEVSAYKTSGPIHIAQLFGSEPFFWRFFDVTAIILTAFVFLDFLPVPRTSFSRLIPLLMEKGFNKRVSYKSYRLFQRLLWIPIITVMLWNIISDIILLL